MTPRQIYDFHQWFTTSFQHLLRNRYRTFHQALLLAVARNVKNIVETGTTREPGNWAGDGQSTYVFGAFAQRFGCKLWTCDVAAEAIAAARQVTAPFQQHIEYVVADSVTFLRDFDQSIDFLYLDSLDFLVRGDPNPPQDHAVREARAALHALHNQSIIVVDDCDLPHGGKGGKVVPFLLGEGWQAIGLGYQVVLTLGIAGD
jgi:predicted O-methyltransferase YrrM